MTRRILVAVLVIVAAFTAVAVITKLDENKFDHREVPVDQRYWDEHPDTQVLQGTLARVRENLRRVEVVAFLALLVGTCALVIVLMRRCPVFAGGTGEMADPEARRIADEAWDLANEAQTQVADTRDRTARITRRLRGRLDQVEARVGEDARHTLMVGEATLRANRHADQALELAQANRERFGAVGREIGRNRASITAQDKKLDKLGEVANEALDTSEATFDLLAEQAEELRRVAGVAEKAGQTAIANRAAAERTDERVEVLGQFARVTATRTPSDADFYERRGVWDEINEKFPEGGKWEVKR